MRIVIGLTAALVLVMTGSIWAADFDGDSRDDVAVFRPSNGRWNIRGVTTIYFGTSADTPLAGDFNGDGIAEPAYHRASTNLWKAKDVTRFYFGNSSQGDEAIMAGGGGQRLYDYVVKAGDADDLVAALESTTYKSVFIPGGSYSVQTDIRVNGVELITGGGRRDTWIVFDTNCGMFLETSWGLTLEKLSFQNGGDIAHVIVEGGADNTRIINVDSYYSDSAGFRGNSSANNVSLINCQAIFSDSYGFYNFIDDCVLTNCVALGVGLVGFNNCDNLTSCVVDGDDQTSNGFYNCDQMSSCRAWDCTNGINACDRVSACNASSNTAYGFYNCRYLAACYANGNGTNWGSCGDTAACNDGT